LQVQQNAAGLPACSRCVPQTILVESMRMGERSTSLAGIADGLCAVTSVDECVPAQGIDDLVAIVRSRRPHVIVVDRDHPSALAALQRIDALPTGERPLAIAVTSALAEALPGARVVVHRAVVDQALALLNRAAQIDVRKPIAVTRILGVSILDGALDQALDTAAAELAAAFGVDRCVLSVRGDSIGGAASGSQTWDSLAWSVTAEHCRAAVVAGTTVVAPASSRTASCESYLAVPLGAQGFLGIVVERARVFPRDHGEVLSAVAARITRELGWRTAHQRTSDELERQLSLAGIDPQYGMWNRLATSQLAAMLVSAARRQGTPLVALVVDVLELSRINGLHGLDIGDRVLRRVGDAIRISVRAEDLVGRWGGGAFAVLLPATPLDGAHRVAERIHAALAARPLDLASGDTLPIDAAVGVGLLQPGEDAEALVGRAAWAAKRSQSHGVARASTGPVPRLSDPEIRVEFNAALGGAYRLLHEISRGGMGVVYRAEDLALERPVAIKMLRPDLAEDVSFVEGLRREAAILARLQHPNLVQIYNFGQSGGDSYFVMELVEGEGLGQAFARHRLEGTTMPIAELLVVLEQIASALDALHERGVIHRDIKPANIIRDPFRNRSVLVDVGIARRYGQFAEGAGTPGYCAPEVITGGEATARSDVYGLAATAYALLTLHAPFGDDGDVLVRQCTDYEVPPASTYRAELAVIDSVLADALDRDPTRRPASAGAFARALKAGVASLVAARPPEIGRWVGQTVMPSRSRTEATTRGVVFRSVTRALGVRDAERLRDVIGGTRPELARAISDASPLSWLPTQLLRDLLAIAPAHIDRDSAMLARDVARAAVRASFRRFFPASAATLVPESTLSAIRSVWGRYQSWGTVASMPVRAAETVVRIDHTPKDADLCAWTSGMLEQLVVLSGGKTPVVDHEACEARGDEACLYRVMWK
jgi:diguanylate cyclase (GGDEF)-like protein